MHSPRWVGMTTEADTCGAVLDPTDLDPAENHSHICAAAAPTKVVKVAVAEHNYYLSHLADKRKPDSILGTRSRQARYMAHPANLPGSTDSGCNPDPDILRERASVTDVPERPHKPLGLALLTNNETSSSVKDSAQAEAVAVDRTTNLLGHKRSAGLAVETMVSAVVDCRSRVEVYMLQGWWTRVVGTRSMRTTLADKGVTAVARTECAMAGSWSSNRPGWASEKVAAVKGVVEAQEAVPRTLLVGSHQQERAVPIDEAVGTS